MLITIATATCVHTHTPSATYDCTATSANTCVRSPSAIAATSNITSHSCADLLYHTRNIPRHPRPNATPQTRLWLTSVEWDSLHVGTVQRSANLVAIEHAGRTVTSGFTVIRGDEQGLSLPIPLLLPVPRSPSRYFCTGTFNHTSTSAANTQRDYCLPVYVQTTIIDHSIQKDTQQYASCNMKLKDFPTSSCIAIGV